MSTKNIYIRFQIQVTFITIIMRQVNEKSGPRTHNFNILPVSIYINGQEDFKICNRELLCKKLVLLKLLDQI